MVHEQRFGDVSFHMDGQVHSALTLATLPLTNLSQQAVLIRYSFLQSGMSGDGLCIGTNKLLHWIALYLYFSSWISVTLLSICSGAAGQVSQSTALEREAITGHQAQARPLGNQCWVHGSQDHLQSV
jgi:hypothetical protein